MEHPNDAFSPLAIARREELRQARGTALIALAAEAIAGGTMAWGGPGSWLNQAAGLGLHGPVAASEIDRLVAFYRDRGGAPRIEVASCADPSLFSALAARGFVLRGIDHVLARPLPAGERFEALLPHGWPRGVELVEVRAGEEARIEQFVAASTVGFRPANEPIAPVVASFARGIVESATAESFLALVDGEPAGGGSVEFDGDHAGLISTSVDPRYRRRGIQQALIARRLERARARGARHAAIQAEPGNGTERNALRMGFRIAYAKALLELPAR